MEIIILGPDIFEITGNLGHIIVWGVIGIRWEEFYPRNFARKSRNDDLFFSPYISRV
jgi:hypothetical protein